MLNASMIGFDGSLNGLNGDDLAALAANLKKSLEIGTIASPTSAAGTGPALRPEFLEATLTSLTRMPNQFKIYARLPKPNVNQAYGQYNVQTSFGADGEFTQHDGISRPIENDFIIGRRTWTIGSKAVAGRVPLVSLVTNFAHGTAYQLERRNKTMELLTGIQRGIWFGDSTLNPYQTDGLIKQIRNAPLGATVLDVRGRTVSREEMGNLVTQAGTDRGNGIGFGMPTEWWMSPQALQKFSDVYYATERTDASNANRHIMPGAIAEGMMTSMGPIAFNTDVMLTPGPRISNAKFAAAMSNAPLAPTVSTAAASAPGTGQFGGTDAGTYFYWAVPYGDYGHGARIAVNAVALTVASGDTVTFTLTPSGVGPGTRYFKIFRTRTDDPTAGNARQIMDIPAAGATVITDTNAYLPGCVPLVGLDNRMENNRLLTLLPPVLVPFATNDFSRSFGIISLQAPSCRIPEWNALVENTFAEY